MKGSPFDRSMKVLLFLVAIIVLLLLLGVLTYYSV